MFHIWVWDIFVHQNTHLVDETPVKLLYHKPHMIIICQTNIPLHLTTPSIEKEMPLQYASISTLD